MKELIHFLPTYFARNFGITLQGILFALANDASFFRALSGKKRIPMREIPVRMISFGGSNYNISFLIRESDKKHDGRRRISDTSR